MIKIELSWSRLFFDCMLDIQSALKILRYWSLSADPPVFVYWWSYCYQKGNLFFTKCFSTSINWKRSQNFKKREKAELRKNCGKRVKKRKFSAKSGRSGNPGLHSQKIGFFVSSSKTFRRCQKASKWVKLLKETIKKIYGTFIYFVQILKKVS